MLTMTFALRWSWVLGIALFLPVALPAGGGERYKSAISLREDGDSLFAGDCCVLQVSPFAVAPSLCKLRVGTPLRVLRSWQSTDKSEWLQVQIASSEIIELSSSVRRGWLNV